MAAPEGWSPTHTSATGSPEATDGANLRVTAPLSVEPQAYVLTEGITQRTMVYFDIESTIDSFKQTIEIAAICHPSGNAFQTLVAVDSYKHQGYRLGTWVHGIHPDMIRNAPSFPEAIDAFVQFLENEGRHGDMTLVAHNGRAFDMRVLSKQSMRHGFNIHQRLARTGVKTFLDTHPLFQELKSQGTVPSGRLTELHTHYTGVPLEGAHRALADSKALRDVCSYVDETIIKKHIREF